MQKCATCQSVFNNQHFFFFSLEAITKPGFSQNNQAGEQNVSALFRSINGLVKILETQKSK